MGSHEVDGLGRDHFCRHHQIAFVLTILVVDDDEHASASKFVKGNLDADESKLFSSHGRASHCIDQLIGSLCYAALVPGTLRPFASMICRSPPQVGWKIPASIGFRLGEMRGLNSICARMSFSRLIPGAISVSVSCPSCSSNTARSVTNNTGCLEAAA